MTTTNNEREAEIRSVAHTLIVAANNPSSHGHEKGLREIMLKQAARLEAALTREQREGVCPKCNGAGGERWHEADGSENGQRCEACDGFGTQQEAQQDRCNGARPPAIDRDLLGRLVREEWVRWANEQPNPKPSWLVPYDELPEADKEADRRIGECAARWAIVHDAAQASLQPQPETPGAVACEWHGKSLGEHHYVNVPGGRRCIKCKHEITTPPAPVDVRVAELIAADKEYDEAASYAAYVKDPVGNGARKAAATKRRAAALALLDGQPAGDNT